MVSVSAERRLYRNTAGDSFLIHIKVQNMSAKPIGFANASPFVIYQWWTSAQPHNSIVDGFRAVPQPLTAKEKQPLIAQFTSGKSAHESHPNALRRMDPGAAYDYFMSFPCNGTAAWRLHNEFDCW